MGDLVEAFARVVRFAPARNGRRCASPCCSVWHSSLRGEFPADNFVRVCLLAFLLAASGLLTYLLEHIWNALCTKRRETKRRRKIIERLGDLTPEEQHTLRNYVEQERKTINFAPFEGVVELLAKDGILVLLTQNSHPNVLCSETYAIDRTAWEHLNAHPELVP